MRSLMSRHHVARTNAKKEPERTRIRSDQNASGARYRQAHRNVAHRKSAETEPTLEKWAHTNSRMRQLHPENNGLVLDGGVTPSYYRIRGPSCVGSARGTGHTFKRKDNRSSGAVAPREIGRVEPEWTCASSGVAKTSALPQATSGLQCEGYVGAAGGRRRDGQEGDDGTEDKTHSCSVDGPVGQNPLTTCAQDLASCGPVPVYGLTPRGPGAARQRAPVRSPSNPTLERGGATVRTNARLASDSS
jgi:hypothetical protein